jgi:hypothetical protein
MEVFAYGTALIPESEAGAQSSGRSRLLGDGYARYAQPAP